MFVSSDIPTRNIGMMTRPLFALDPRGTKFQQNLFFGPAVSNFVPDKLLQRKREYEKHWKKQSYNYQWEVGRPWLKFVVDRNIMTCQVCAPYYCPKEELSFLLEGETSEHLH